MPAAFTCGAAVGGGVQGMFLSVPEFDNSPGMACGVTGSFQSAMGKILSPHEVAVEWFQRLWIKHDGSVIPELMALGARGELEGGHVTQGPEEFGDFHKLMLGTLPDIRVEVVEIVAEGTQVYSRWVAKGTHKGAAMGLVPTEEEVVFRGITWMTVIDGMITAGGDCWNQGALMAKLQAKTTLA